MKRSFLWKRYNAKKKGRPSHHPLMAFLNGEKYVVNIWNREGATSSGNGVTEFLKETMARLDGRLKIKGCIGDTGFYKIDLIKYLESLCLSYILGVPFYQPIQEEIQKLKDWEVVEDGLAVSEFKFEHQDEKWDKERRYIVVRQEVGVKEVALGKQMKLFKDDYEVSKYRYSCYVTDLEESPLEVWRAYRKRAGDENIIKENTNDFGLEGFSLDNFYATETAMLMRVLFYNLINFFRREILSKDESSDTLSTLRYKYFVIPAQLGQAGRKMILRMGVRTQKMKQKIKWIISKIDEYFKDPPKCIADEAPV